MIGVMKRRPSIFGGSWINGRNAGSRYANLDYWPENSNDDIGVRLCCDDQASSRRLSPVRARQWLRPCRPVTFNGGQPSHPASANTFHGPVQRGVGQGPMPPLRDPRPASFPPTRGRHMGRKYRNLIGRICADDNMREAYRLTAAGKRITPGHLEFKEFGPLNIYDLARDIAEGGYVQGEPHQFNIFDPKLRTITALPFRDRLAQHALCNVIGPILDRALLPRTFACRPGKGTHAGVKLLQADLRRLERMGRPIYALKTDFSRYFASIDRAVLHGMLRAKISCRRTLALIEAMVPPTGIGLAIGSLTSQHFANLYGGVVDRHLQQDLGESWWYRYMDDLVVLGTDPDHLRKVGDSIARLSAERLGLRFSKWSVQPVTRGINFLGYRTWSTHKLLRRDSVTRARRKLAAYRAAGEHEREAKFLAAWTGHAGWADCHNLFRTLAIDIGEPA